MGWADDQIRQKREREESQKNSNELRLREERMKDEVGNGIFDRVKAYVKVQVEKYDKAQLTPSEGMAFFSDTSAEEERDIGSQIPSFTIRKKDGRYGYLYAKYSQSRHLIQWRCGSAEGYYELRVHEDGKGYFVGSDGSPRSPEQIGSELLTRASNADPISGSVYI